MKYQLIPATREHALYIARHMSPADAVECERSVGSKAQGILLSFDSSDQVWTWAVDGVPALMFGFNFDIISVRCAVWMLGTPVILENPKAFVRGSRQVVDEILKDFKEMYGYCDAQHHKSLNWLRRLGFTITGPFPMGVNGDMFMKFERQNKWASIP